ncbi:MAG: putative baseplate assembly protein [Pseudomonadota bacterium]|nr:putative baseplate assembly protein [Pseudomonadota bacterium]
MKDRTCGCCEGTEPLTPLPTANRPSLDTLSYRVGTHGTFFETMVARLTSHRLEDGRRPLQQLTTRAPDDPSLALLDAWATVAGVLTFYQERIANEGYLFTATERRSILELARLVGYKLRPGVASSVFLAFTLEDDFDIEIPAGTLARSLPGPDELPQPFETDEALHAQTAWNALSARLSRPFVLQPELDFSGTRSLFLEGTATDLNANDAVLVVCGFMAQPYTVRAVETDAEADRTTATYTPYGAGSSLAEAERPTRATTAAAPQAPALTRLTEVVQALRKDPSLQPPSRFQLARSPQRTYAATADLGPRLLTKFSPRLADTLYTAYANAPVTGVSPEDLCHVEAMRVKAAPFGNNAPRELVYEDNVLIGRREWALAELKATLDMDLSSSDPDLRVDEAFSQAVDLSAGVFPPLELQITVSDEIGTTPLQPIQPSELAETTPQGAGEPIYEGTFAVRGITVTVRARYEEETTGVFFLRRLTVRFTSGAQARDVVVREGVAVNGSSAFRVEVTGVDQQPVNAGQTQTVELAETNRRVTIALDEDATLLRVTQEESLFATNESVRLLSLDAPFDEILPGSFVLVDRARSTPIVAQVEQVRTLSRADYSISAKVTQLLLDQPWLSDQDTSLALLRGTTVYAQSEELDLSEEPIEDDVSGDKIELDGLYEGLEAGRWVVVKGERTDVRDGNEQVIEGIEASELAMLAGVEHDVRTVLDPNGNEVELLTDTLHTRLILAEPLAYTYKRETVKINANVAKASHGETQRETLGSGNATKAFQKLTLGQAPLTFLAAPTPEGVESTLAVRVNDVRWPEQKTLLYLDGDQRGYETKTDDEGETTVVFGDGKRGARLPTGVENVTAVYRAGIGKGGNVRPGQISALATRPLGVKEVVNPQRASGGADPESRDQARRNVPLGVLALDRLVSVQDYADFARTFAGIGKAHAASLSDGRRDVVYLTIAGADDVPIDPQSDLYRNLLLALGRFGDPNMPLQVVLREAVFLFVSARVKVLEDYLWDKIEPKIRAALLDTLSFDRRELGQDVLLSEFISVIQGIEGVDYVDVDLLDAVSETDALDPETLADKLEALAAVSGAATPPGDSCTGDTQPSQRLVIELARINPASTDPALRIRPAQVAYLNPELPDTLILTEATS